MNRHNDAGHQAEDQPGAEPGVLRNLPGLTSIRDIENAKNELLYDLHAHVLPQPWNTLTLPDMQHRHQLVIIEDDAKPHDRTRMGTLHASHEH